MKNFKVLEKEKISKLPKAPGVYAFKKGRAFLYIGKASNIKERVKNHFRQSGTSSNAFVGKSSEISFIKTASEIEALILEANLIKRYEPKYNVAWKDDKNYFYAAATKELFPRIFVTHQLKPDEGNIQYIGPFVDGKALKTVLKTLQKAFPYRTCKARSEKLPKRPCLLYQIERCSAPCITSIKNKKSLLNRKRDYRKNIKNLINILKGKKPQVISKLKKEMKESSNDQNFEKAKSIRDQILALEKVMAHSQIFFLHPFVPDGIRSKDIFLCWERVQEDFKKLLEIKKNIKRIEGYDISNIQGKQAVGSMVVFIEGKPVKSLYRKFKIKYKDKAVKKGEPNDPAMIKEIISRRLNHSEWQKPDVILVDGGKPQLNAALKALQEDTKNHSIKVIALAKKENKLYVEGKKELILLRSLCQEISNLILQIRDESHRFAISYHRKLRKKTLLEQ